MVTIGHRVEVQTAIIPEVEPHQNLTEVYFSLTLTFTLTLSLSLTYTLSARWWWRLSMKLAELSPTVTTHNIGSKQG